MSESLDPAAIARQPLQQRARVRFDCILREAEALLSEKGLSGFSIPEIASRLNYTRGSIYSYFPTPYALLNELAQTHLDAIEAILQGQVEQLRGMTWQAGTVLVVDTAVAYYESHPVSRLLILGGAVTDDSYRAQERTSRRLGELGRAIWPEIGALPRSNPDVTTLFFDIGLACLRRSFFEHGKITPEYRDATITAMTGFAEPYVGGAIRGGGHNPAPDEPSLP